MSRTTRSRNGAAKSGKRREELRRNLPKPAFDHKALLQRPEVVYTALTVLAFLLTVSCLVLWSREQIKVADGQIMTHTRLKRVDYQVPDEDATRAKREEAKLSAPEVWRLHHTYLDRLAATLNGLPKAVAGKTSTDELSEELRAEFALTDEGLEALQEFAVGGETTPRWKTLVTRLTTKQLPANPLITRDEYQNRWAPREYSKTLKRLLRYPDGTYEEIEKVDAIELSPDSVQEIETRLGTVVASALFPPSVVPYVTSKLMSNPQPTFLFDDEQTALFATAAEERVESIFTKHYAGEVIYKAGDELTDDQCRELQIESQMFAALAPLPTIWMPRLGVVGLIALLVLLVSAYVAATYPRVIRNGLRVIAIAVLLCGMLTLTVIVTVQEPNLIFPATLAPALFVALVVRLAYDQRLALVLGGAQAALVTLALDQGIGWFILMLAGCGAVTLQLREVRHRSSVVRAASVTAAVLGVGTIMLGLLELPITEGVIRQIIFSATWGVTSSYAVGFLVLGIMPSIERLFDITTGMTLAELRDPKQPLLRQLQQKAPGTYNHSLQVANVAEAATEAIGGDGLLVYVGALYHDIGKMNKPEYFVENQAGGQNKHDKLSPAMSLLVIIGHVKDGIELAREYGLPRQLQHFIESHHGTTLVEYFYHAAKTQAELDEKKSVEEVEFRYPGPKPRTKEAAILMLSDAVESATRAMTDPTPGRIESLVREISAKRLADGQFDQSELTFRELGLIVESTITRLCAVHHSRISYPSDAAREQAESAKSA